MMTAETIDPMLLRDLARQPWLTESERIERIVAAAVMAAREDEIAEEMRSEAFKDGKDESDGEWQDKVQDLRDLLQSAHDLLTELRELGSEDQQETVDELLDEIGRELK